VIRRRTLLLAGLGSAGSVHAQAETLRLGLAPYLSPTALLTTFRPVREHLQRVLQQPVEAVTARDFVALAAATQRSEYDIAMLPAHMARLAVADWRWMPLVRTVDATQVQVLVRDGGPVKTPADLRGRRVGMLDLLSLTAAVGVQWLRSQVPPLIDAVEIVPLPSINSALFALQRDEVHAVVAAATQRLSLPAQTPTQQRVLAVLTEIPGPWYVSRPDTPAAALARWREALVAFSPDPNRPTTAANARLTLLTPADTEAMEVYAAHLRRQLAAR
jgi:phosphonate transport system substrate-binding protein